MELLCLTGVSSATSVTLCDLCDPSGICGGGVAGAGDGAALSDRGLLCDLCDPL